MNLLNVSLMARGKFIWFLGDDDLLTKNSLNFLTKLIKKNKKINFFWINSYYLDVSYLKKFPKKFDINFLPKNLKTHSPQKKDKILNFFDLIDHRICFDYLLGIYVNCFNRMFIECTSLFGRPVFRLPINLLKLLNELFFCKGLKNESMGRSLGQFEAFNFSV